MTKNVYWLNIYVHFMTIKMANLVGVYFCVYMTSVSDKR